MVVDFLKSIFTSDIMGEVFTVILLVLIYIGAKGVLKLLKKHNIEVSSLKPVIVQIADKMAKKVVEKQNAKNSDMKEIHENMHAAVKDTILDEKKEENKETK